MNRSSLLGLFLAVNMACGDTEALEPTRTLVFRSVDFGRLSSRRVAVGFDLDGMATNSREARGCAQDDFTSPEGVPGIDNNLSLLIPLLDLAAEGALQALLQMAVNEGRLLVFLEEIPREGGGTQLRFRRGDDTPLLGTDGRLLPGQTLGLHADPNLGLAPSSSVTGEVVEATGFDVRIPAVIFTTLYVLDFKDARVRYEVDSDGAVRGMLGGGLELEQIFDIIRTADAMINPNSSIENLVGEELRTLGDLLDDQGRCQRISATVTFEAVPAFVF